MTTTLDIGYDGPPVCVPCRQVGLLECHHTGFLAENWAPRIQQAITAPGLDPSYDHVVTNVTISTDHKVATLTIDTRRPWHREMAREISILFGPKAHVRAFVDGVLVAENRLDAFCQVGETVYVNGDPHVVVDIEHPGRGEHGICTTDRDWQHAHLRALEPESVTFPDEPDESPESGEPAADREGRHG